MSERLCDWCGLTREMVDRSRTTPVDDIRALVSTMGTQKAVADALCLSEQYICDILAGRREVSERVAGELGYRRVVSFVPLLPSARDAGSTDADPTPSEGKTKCVSPVIADRSRTKT